MHVAIKVANHLVKMANDAGQTDMTPLKLMKTTYIAHGWMLGLYGDPLVSEDVEAWQYGPVIPEMYRETSTFQRKHITSLPNEYVVELTEQEMSIVKQTFEGYSNYTAGQLVALTHKKGTPWHLITEGKHYGAGVVIPNGIIRDYYQKLPS